MRGHRRGARDGAQQRDLAHSVAAAVPAEKLAVLLGVELARGDREIGIARISLPDQHVSGAQLHRPQRRRQALDRGGGQFGEQRERAQQRDLHDRHGGTGVEAEHGASAGHGRQRQHGRHPEHGQPASAQVRQRGYQQGTQGEPGHHEPLEDAEDPPDQLRRDRPLQQGAGGHRQQGVAGPGHRQQGHGAGQAETERDHRQRAAEDQRGRQDRPAQAAPDQDRAHGGRQQRSGAESELEVAGPARGAAEHGQGQDHDQQVQRPRHDGIGGQQGQHEPQPRLTDRQPQAARRSRAVASVRHSGSAASGATRRPATSSAASRPRPAHTANTLPTPASEISTPASSPAAATPAASIQPATTLAAVS